MTSPAPVSAGTWIDNGTTAADLRRALGAAMVLPGGPTAPRPGRLPGPGTPLTVSATSPASRAVLIKAGKANTYRSAAYGPTLGVGPDGDVTLPMPGAPVSGSQWRLVYLLQRDTNPPANDATGGAIIGEVLGAASSSPVKPALPAGALLLGEVLDTAGAATITAAMVTDRPTWTNARGGMLRVADETERDALSAYPTLTVLVESTGRVQTYTATGEWATLYDLARERNLAPNVVGTWPVTDVLEPAVANGFYNARHLIWPQGDGPIAVGAGAQLHVNGGWRVVSHLATGPTITATKADPIRGGIRLVINYNTAGQWAYLRQLVPDVASFSGGEFTITADVETSGEVGVEVYVQARINDDDLQRILVIDSDTTILAAGRKRVAAKFTVPNLELVAGTWNDRNCLEAAVRFVSTGTGSRTVTVRECALTPGASPRGPVHSDPARDAAMVYAYDEKVLGHVRGLNPASGQKACAFQWTVPKLRSIAIADVIIRDAAGTGGAYGAGGAGSPARVTTYDATGAATNNVPITALQGNAAGNGADKGGTVVINSSTAAGILFTAEVRNY